MFNYLPEVARVSRFNTAVLNRIGRSDPGRVMMVDDHELSRLAALDLLKLDGYQAIEADGSSDIVAGVLSYQPDLILLDVNLGQTSGYQVCQQLKTDRRTASIPIILMSVADDRQSRIQSRDVGADGFLAKPLDRIELLTKAELLVQKKRLYEGLVQVEQVLCSIAQAVEGRYSDRKTSPAKLDQLAETFGEYLRLSPRQINDLILAARLHDIGTVAIPDAVLLKKAELTEEERELLKQHVLLGEQICRPLASRSDVPQIIRHHHERWDGSGYPDGLAGHDIPWLAQVFQVLDIYDALTSERAYKKALSPLEALETIVGEAAKGWRNPELVREFAAFIRTAELER